MSTKFRVQSIAEIRNGFIYMLVIVHVLINYR